MNLLRQLVSIVCVVFVGCSTAPKGGGGGVLPSKALVTSLAVAGAVINPVGVVTDSYKAQAMRKSEEKWRAFDQAIQREDQSALEIQLQSNPEFRGAGLSVAVRTARPAMVEFFYARVPNADPDYWLHFICSEPGNTPAHLEVVRFFLDKNAKVNSLGTNDISPLMRATSRLHHELAALLIERGADTTLPNARGETALHYLAWAEIRLGKTKADLFATLRLLLGHGAQVDIPDRKGQSFRLLLKKPPNTWGKETVGQVLALVSPKTAP